MEQTYFTDEDLIETLREGLWYQYLKYPVIQNYLEFDDLVNECVLGWYETMKSTGEVRIEHYRKTLTWKHIKNMVKLSTYQVVPNYLKSNAVKFQPLSLNATMSGDEDEDAKEFIDLVPSLDEDILESAVNEDIINILSKEEKSIVMDLLSGFTKTALRDKYTKFDYIMEDIREKVAKYFIAAKPDLLPSSIQSYADKLI